MTLPGQKNHKAQDTSLSSCSFQVIHITSAAIDMAYISESVSCHVG